jgi:hypothetical protein
MLSNDFRHSASPALVKVGRVVVTLGALIPGSITVDVKEDERVIPAQFGSNGLKECSESVLALRISALPESAPDGA